MAGERLAQLRDSDGVLVENLKHNRRAGLGLLEIHALRWLKPSEFGVTLRWGTEG